jgi:hypothetical protein
MIIIYEFNLQLSKFYLAFLMFTEKIPLLLK